MKMIEKIREKIKAYKEMYYIWRKRPTATFQEITDIWTKEPMLKKARKNAVDMLKRDQFMFNEVSNALLTGEIIRKTSKGKTESIVDILQREDEKINEYTQQIRREVMNYMADNSAPNVEASLVLTSLVIDLERLGDQTKDLAKLTLISKPDFEKRTYMRDIEKQQRRIMGMFDKTITAFENKDKEVAGEVMDDNVSLRNETDVLLHTLSTDKNIRGREMLMYTLYIRFYRRAAAHLENIASSVISPFPYLGFKSAPDVKLHKKRKKMSRIVKKKSKTAKSQS
ncbi:MAG: PhoU domain-containing protein [archaeon]